MLSPAHWFWNQNIQSVLTQALYVVLRKQLGATDWVDLFVIEGFTVSSIYQDHHPWSAIVQYLQPHRLQSTCPAFLTLVLSSDVGSLLLSSALQALLDEVSSQPLPASGTRDNFTQVAY